MTVAPNTIYRFSIWLPILVPAVVLAIGRAAEVRLAEVFVLEILLYSLLYGGLPYAALALVATLWTIGRQEQEIERIMFRAPWIMAGGYALLAVVVALVSGPVTPFLAVGFLGAVVSVALGYFYVGMAVTLRHLLGPPERSRGTALR